MEARSSITDKLAATCYMLNVLYGYMWNALEKKAAVSRSWIIEYSLFQHLLGRNMRLLDANLAAIAFAPKRK